MKKVANYRIASHVVGQAISLQAALNRCVENYPDDDFPVFDFRQNENCLIARHEPDVGGRTFIHLVCYEEGAGAAVVETVKSASVDEVLPPDQREFIKLQMFFICSGEHVIFVGHNSVARDRTVEAAINTMLQAFGGFEEAPAFHLEARLNDAKFNHILQNGIEEIDLNAGGFRQSMEYLRDHGKIDGGGFIGFLQSLVPEADAAADQAADDVVVRMKLKPRAYMWDKPGVKSLLGAVAANVVEQDDEGEGSEGFSIVTKSGLTIRHDELRVREYVNVEGNSRVLDVDEVAQGLNWAFAELAARGVMN